MFAGVSVLQGGAAVLLALGVYLILTGKLVWYKNAQKQLDQVTDICDQRVKQANEETGRWRAAYEYSESARQLQAQHANELLEIGRTTNRVIAALSPSPEGEPDATASAMER